MQLNNDQPELNNENFPRLFSPIDLCGHSLRNRIVFGAHTANMSEQGLPGERHLAYYRERALGGAAMLVIEPIPVHPAAVLTRGNFRNSTDEVIPHFRKITDAVHEEGALILQQLYHVGQHGDSDNSYHANWSPSGMPSYHDSDGSHSMNEAEIEETIEGFVQPPEDATTRVLTALKFGRLITAWWINFGHHGQISAQTVGGARW